MPWRDNMKPTKVDGYLEKQKSPQKEICKKLRKISLKTIPKNNEQIRWGVTSYKQGKFYIAPLKDSVNLGFSIKGLSKEEIKYFSGSEKYLRHLKFRTLEDIDEKKIVKLLNLVDKKAECVDY
jgi:hypothetical protein